eukprot:gene5830-6270_t
MEEVKIVSIPQERRVDGKVFPLTIVPEEHHQPGHLFLWLERNREIVDDLLRKHRILLFRGFSEMTDYQDFHRFVESTGYLGMDYIGGAAVRTQLTSRVFTANESPSSEKIPFHHEMAQTPDPPTHLFFFCEIPPATGGETPVLVSNEIYRRISELHPEEMRKIEELGVKYVRVMPEEDDPMSAIGRGWKSTFLCNTREEAEVALQKLGSSWEWLSNGDLKTVTALLPAVKVDAGVNRSDVRTFFNSLVAAYTGWNDVRNDGTKAVVSGDGEYLSPQLMEDAKTIMDEISVAVPWQKGDVFLVDNRTAMHSRRPFEGPRRILAALARDPNR